MKQKTAILWFSVVSVILVVLGLVFMIFGLGILPVPEDVLLDWETALYGAIMVGWGVTLFMVGRIALRRNDLELKKALWVGVLVWLIGEAFFSAKLGVWFNVGVDAGVLVLFSIPLLQKLRSK